MDLTDAVWLACGVGGVVAIVAWTVHLTRHPKGRFARAMSAWFTGILEEDVVPPSVPEIVAGDAHGALASDANDARAFVTDTRVASDRASVHFESRGVRLTERGTALVTALVAADGDTAVKVARALRPHRLQRWLSLARHRPSLVSDQDAQAFALVERWAAAGGHLRLHIGGSDVELTDQGSLVLAAVLCCGHRELDRVERVLGTGMGYGWADWVPSHRVEHVARDHYLDTEIDPWTVGRRPTLGGKRTSHRR